MSDVTIFVADDHEMVRAGIKHVLARHDGLVVAGEAGNGDAMLARVRAERFDVVLTDLAMPGISGLDLIRRILRERADAAILVHSMYVDGQTAARAIKAGARGYVTKGSNATTLVEGIRQVALGKRFISPDLVDEVLSGLNADNDGLPHERLSEREFQVFRMFVEGRTVNAVAEALSLSPKTVSTHKMRLMRRMNIKTDSELVRYAIAHALIA
jgi:DNA-binding NarL/FixJ family response regulator